MMIDSKTIAVNSYEHDMITTLFYKGAWIQSFRDGTVMVQLPIPNSNLYHTKQVKSSHAAKLFITKNQEYLNRAYMKRTLSEANEIESKLLTYICDAMDLLNDIHVWGDANLDRTKLWEKRARVQDALRAMYDLHQLRKNLPYVNPDLGTN